MSLKPMSNQYEQFSKLHDNFVNYRIRKLKKEAIRRKAEITEVSDSASECKYYETIRENIIQMHSKHSICDKISKKKVSFGLVRLANIKACVELTKHFIRSKEWPEDFRIKTMAYHSQQVLIMRSEQEKHLDEVLNRKNEQDVFQNSTIKEQLSEIQNAKNVIYILVATPVEEIGRDHDFDWAIVEPSSYRSIIQLAGRVLRHRCKEPKEPNIALMQYNLRSLNAVSEQCVFNRPGYETKEHLLDTHDLLKLVDKDKLSHSVDAIPRIKANQKLNAKKSLVDLEHEVMSQALNKLDIREVDFLEGWLSGYWWLTGLSHKCYSFRKEEPHEKIHLFPSEMEDCDTSRWSRIECFMNISHDKENWEKYKGRFWLWRDYEKLLHESTHECGDDLVKKAEHYGELSLKLRNNYKWEYSPQFGIYKKSSETAEDSHGDSYSFGTWMKKQV